MRPAGELATGMSSPLWAMGREKRKKLVFAVSFWDPWHFFLPFPSSSPNHGHKNHSEFCLVPCGEVYWMSGFIKVSSGSSSFFVKGLGLVIGYVSPVSPDPWPGPLMLQVVRRPLRILLFSSHFTGPRGPLWVQRRVAVLYLQYSWMGKENTEQEERGSYVWEQRVLRLGGDQYLYFKPRWYLKNGSVIATRPSRPWINVS